MGGECDEVLEGPPQMWQAARQFGRQSDEQAKAGRLSLTGHLASRPTNRWDKVGIDCVAICHGCQHDWSRAVGSSQVLLVCCCRFGVMMLFLLQLSFSLSCYCCRCSSAIPKYPNWNIPTGVAVSV